MTSRLDELKDRHVENILDEDQLEKVAGGTARENGQLYTAIRMNPALFNEIGGIFGIEDVLKDKFGIYYNSITQNKNHAHKKNLYLGPADPNAPRGTPGALPTKMLTHEEVLQRIKNYGK